jgi:hypothetical protein
MLYRSNLDPASKRGFQPSRDFSYKRQRQDALAPEHRAELKHRIRVLTNAGPGDAARARSDAMIYLNFINGLGDLTPKEFVGVRESIKQPTKKELADQARLQPRSFRNRIRIR